MKRKLGLGILLVGMLAVALPANAAIIDWNCADDGDGAIVMGTSQLTPAGDEYVLGMSGAQHWVPGHVEGDFTTDTPLDPTVWIQEELANDTTFAWTGYKFVIGMTKDFTIGTTGIIAPAGWTWQITQPPIGGGQALPNGAGTGWVGEVNYTGGTPIGIGDPANFGLKVSFLGSVAFVTEQTPVPEPVSLALLAMGGLALLRRR